MIVRVYDPATGQRVASCDFDDPSRAAIAARTQMTAYDVILTLTPSIELALPRTSTAAEIESEIRAMIGP